MPDDTPPSVSGRDTRPWRAAWRDCHLGSGGFYRRHNAEDEFSTGVHVDDTLARYLADLIARQRANDPGEDFAVIDIGAGAGRLLADLRKLLPGRINFIGIDVRSRPANLHETITWMEREIDPSSSDITGQDGQWSGVLIAHEFLDDIPCDVVELDDNCDPRIVLVDPTTGAQELGPALTDRAVHRFTDEPERDRAWLAQWWPPTKPGARREIGWPRDVVWNRLRRVVSNGQAIAIDYGHERVDRLRGVWDGGTLKGFASGRPRRPIPNNTMNITAHVALDACAGDHASVLPQSQVLPGLAGFPGGRGSYQWLIEPRLRR